MSACSLYCRESESNEHLALFMCHREKKSSNCFPLFLFFLFSSYFLSLSLFLVFFFFSNFLIFAFSFDVYSWCVGVDSEFQNTQNREYAWQWTPVWAHLVSLVFPAPGFQSKLIYALFLVTGWGHSVGPSPVILILPTVEFPFSLLLTRHTYFVKPGAREVLLLFVFYYSSLSLMTCCCWCYDSVTLTIAVILEVNHRAKSAREWVTFHWYWWPCRFVLL